jgi:predicted amidohydrolase YtcJ
VANYKALETAALIDLSNKTIKSNVCIPGGKLDLDENGQVTGIVRERAVEPIIAAFTKHKTFEQKMRFLKEGMQLCLETGITSVQTNDEACLQAYQKLESEDELPIRIMLTPVHAELSVLNESGLKAKSVIQNNKLDPSSRLSFDRVKIFSDGSLGAETAALKTSSSSYKGMLIHETPQLEEMLRSAWDVGFRTEIHAIGDAAAEQVLCAIDKVNLEGKSSNRPILTHCQVLSPQAIELMKKYNIIADVQPSFVPTGKCLYHLN